MHEPPSPPPPRSAQAGREWTSPRSQVMQSAANTAGGGDVRVPTLRKSYSLSTGEERGLHRSQARGGRRPTGRGGFEKVDPSPSSSLSERTEIISHEGQGPLCPSVNISYTAGGAAPPKTPAR